MDPSGNLYGGTETGGPSGGAGTVWELSPSNGGWIFSVIYDFTGSSQGGGPGGRLAIDGSGTLYGMTAGDDSSYNGNVFKLTPSNGGWIYTDLHDFSGSDGGGSEKGVILDSHGNIYGTTPSGGQYGYGTVWEITP
jgi:uncharacterized repeat protein (TIGR03803 family)